MGGALCIYIGSQLLAKWQIIASIVGAYMIVIGIVMIIYGHFAERQLKKMAEELWSKKAQMQRLGGKEIDFDKLDMNKDGFIDLQEVRAACDEIEMPMSKN